MHGHRMTGPSRIPTRARMTRPSPRSTLTHSLRSTSAWSRGDGLAPLVSSWYSVPLDAIRTAGPGRTHALRAPSHDCPLWLLWPVRFTVVGLPGGDPRTPLAAARPRLAIKAKCCWGGRRGWQPTPSRQCRQAPSRSGRFRRNSADPIRLHPPGTSSTRCFAQTSLRSTARPGKVACAGCRAEALLRPGQATGGRRTGAGTPKTGRNGGERFPPVSPPVRRPP